MGTWEGKEAPPQARELRQAAREMMKAFEEEVGENSHPPEVRSALQLTVATADAMLDMDDYEWPLTLFPLDQPHFKDAEPTPRLRQMMARWNDFAALWNEATSRPAPEPDEGNTL